MYFINYIIEYVKYHFNFDLYSDKNRIKNEIREKTGSLFISSPYSFFVPKKLSELEHLIKLTVLGDAGRTTVLPTWVLNFKKLEKLELGYFDFEKIPIQFSNSNSIDDASIAIKHPHKHITHLKHLKFFTLKSCSLNSIPLGIFELNSLEILHLMGNSIEEIPKSINLLKNLKELDVSENDIHIIDEALAKMPNLHALWLHDNNLQTMPKEIVASNKLLTLTIRDNPFEKKPEIKELGLTELKEFFGMEEHAKGKVEVDEIFRTAFQQYLLYFKDYVRIAKVKNIYFEVERIENGLLIKLKQADQIPLERVETYFKEYLSFARHGKVGTIKMESNITIQEADLLKKNLELQVNNLNKQLQFNERQINNFEKSGNQINSVKDKLFNLIERSLFREEA